MLDAKIQANTQKTKSIDLGTVLETTFRYWYLVTINF